MSTYISTITPTLPLGQLPVETSSVERFYGFLQLVLKAADGRRPVIGIVYSDRAGIGKSTAILAAVECVLPESPTGRPNALLLELEPDIAPMAFLELILKVLDERPRGRTQSHLRQSVIESIMRNDVRLMVFDEADQFSRRTFEELRYIAGKTGCPMLLVGLKKIISVVRPYEQLDSRSFRTHIFYPPEDLEVLTTLFPHLVLSRWHFDSAHPEHMKMGRYIWQKTKPSLRLACGIIEVANDIAELQDATCVTLEHIEEALCHVRRSGLTLDSTHTPLPNGAHEQTSEARHRAKQKNQDEAA